VRRVGRRARLKTARRDPRSAHRSKGSPLSRAERA